jgi:signal transduction histidine kinase
VLARLHATLSNGDEDENTVYTTITRTVAQAVHSPAVALALHRGPHIETVSITGAAQDTPLLFPLIYRGERLGEMRVSPRTPGEPYGRVDRALLDQLANQTSALIYALRRDSELQSIRRRALESVAEERARLGRDLHDGIAPLLAGAGLMAEALRKGMTPGTADEQDAERLASRLRNAATEIRRLAHDLQPAPVGSWAHGSASGLHRDARRNRDADDPAPRRYCRILADGSGARGLFGGARSAEQCGRPCPRESVRSVHDSRTR